jgi:2-polyprenyl-6-hydroxyphenyl methylase/3-demethylubiquinone-9 3-methyltransferase
MFRQLNDDGTIPADDCHFDLVWSTEVIEHVFDIAAFLAEVERVLKPGGTFILTTPYHGVLKNILVCLLKFEKHFDPEGPHIRFFDKAGLRRCLAKAGLRTVRWQGIGRLPWVWRTWFVSCCKPETRPYAA